MKIYRIEEAHTFLKKYGKEIGRLSASGNYVCRKIMEMYTLHYTCPGDPGAQAFLVEAINEYREREEFVREIGPIC